MPSRIRQFTIHPTHTQHSPPTRQAGTPHRVPTRIQYVDVPSFFFFKKTPCQMFSHAAATTFVPDLSSDLLYCLATRHHQSYRATSNRSHDIAIFGFHPTEKVYSFFNKSLVGVYSRPICMSASPGLPPWRSHGVLETERNSHI
jgi:hypothetical protein